jgi:hypothetical protein
VAEDLARTKFLKDSPMQVPQRKVDIETRKAAAAAAAVAGVVPAN